MFSVHLSHSSLFLTSVSLFFIFSLLFFKFSLSLSLWLPLQYLICNLSSIRIQSVVMKAIETAMAVVLYCLAMLYRRWIIVLVFSFRPEQHLLALLQAELCWSLMIRSEPSEKRLCAALHNVKRTWSEKRSGRDALCRRLFTVPLQHASTWALSNSGSSCWAFFRCTL